MALTPSYLPNACFANSSTFYFNTTCSITNYDIEVKEKGPYEQLIDSIIEEQLNQAEVDLKVLSLAPGADHTLASQPQSLSPQFRKKGRIEELTLDRIKKEGKKSEKKRHFTVLFTGDTHSYLEPSVAPKDISEKSLGGVVRRIHYFESVQKLFPDPVLILDTGDFLQGTPYFEQFQGEPDIQFMNMAGYHVVAIGNHDFDNGWEHLEKLLEKGQFKAICANIFRKSDKKRCLPPYSLLTIGESKVAVVNVMGKSAWNSIRPSLRIGLELVEPLAMLDQVLAEIRPYCDLVILLSHAGIEEDRIFARHPMVDAVLGGHSHTFMRTHEIVESATAGVQKRTPVFHAFRHGQLVGKVDFTLEHGRLAETTSSVEQLDERYDAPHESQELLQHYKNTLGQVLKEPLGLCHSPLSAKNKMQKLIPLGVAIADILRHAGAADVGCIYSGTIKVGIEQGPVTVEDVHSVLPHTGPLLVATMKGSLLLEIMQEGYKRWGHDRTFQYSGIVVEADGHSASIQGNKVQNESLYKVAAPSFFFEREVQDENFQLLPHAQGRVLALEEKEKDMRVPIINFIKAHGIKESPAAPNSMMTTLSEIAAHAVSGAAYKPKRAAQPATVKDSRSYQLLKGETTDEICKRVREYVQGRLAYDALAADVTAQNAYQYLAAVKISDMEIENASTFKVRELCVLKSEANPRRKDINIFNAFSTPPAHVGDMTRLIANELDNTHPEVENLPDGDQKSRLLFRIYQYSQEEAHIVPQFVPVIESIMRERLQAMRRVSQHLPPKTLIFYAGPSGAGKSHALRPFIKSLIPDMPMTQAVHSTDNIKLDLREKTGEIFSDRQVFLLGLSMNKMMMQEVRKTYPGLSIIQEGWLITRVVKTMFEDLNRTGMRLEMRDFDGDFLAICLRVLSRHNDPKRPNPAFIDVVRGFKNGRDSRSLLLQSKRESDSYSLHFVQNDGNVVEINDPGSVNADSATLDAEIEATKSIKITEEHAEHFGESLRQFIGSTIIDAMMKR